ncbi:MAG: hypothetical protein ACI4WX_03655 [Aristaeellaceae bacterium]
MKQFEGNEFAVEVLSRGSFVDATYPDKVYQVEAMTLRVNWVAMNDFNVFSVIMDREDFSTDAEYGEYNTKLAQARLEWRENLIHAIGLDESQGTIYVMKVISEIFAVCQMTELKSVWKA